MPYNYFDQLLGTPGHTELNCFHQTQSLLIVVNFIEPVFSDTIYGSAAASSNLLHDTMGLR